MKKTFFPSYQKIYSKIKQEQTKQYRQKLDKMDSKIKHLKSRIDFDEQHKQLTKKLIYEYKRQNQFQKPFYQPLCDLAIVQNKRNAKYADSLNQYLDNSEQQQNNYEGHLKFRKKALQRQLQADQQKKNEQRHQKTGGNGNEQLFFRKLYSEQTHKFNLSKSKQNTIEYKQMQSRCANLNQNKKKLTQLYLPYVEALAHTNIVKWRILNNPRDSDN